MECYSLNITDTFKSAVEKADKEDLKAFVLALEDLKDDPDDKDFNPEEVALVKQFLEENIEKE